MKQYKEIKKEVEAKILDKVFCDNCKNLIDHKEIEYPEVCGSSYHLEEGICFICGGKDWEFCSLECLKSFVNKGLENKE